MALRMCQAFDHADYRAQNKFLFSFVKKEMKRGLLLFVKDDADRGGACEVAR